MIVMLYACWEEREGIEVMDMDRVSQGDCSGSAPQDA